MRTINKELDFGFEYNHDNGEIKQKRVDFYYGHSQELGCVQADKQIIRQI